MLIRSRLTVSIVCVSLLAVVSPALGDIVSSDPNANPIWHKYDSRDAGANPQGPFTINDTGSFGLPKFDTQSGTRILTAVTMVIEAFAHSGTHVLDNENPTEDGNASITVGASIYVDSQVAGAPLVVVTLPTDSNSGLITADDDPDFFGDFAGLDSIKADAAGATDSNSNTLDTNLGEYIGAGNITWNFDSNTILTYETDVAPFFANSTAVTFDFTAQVIYNWQLLPEPVTGVILGTGAMAMILRRRKRKANRKA